MTWPNLSLIVLILTLSLILAFSRFPRLWSRIRPFATLGFQLSGIIVLTWVLVTLAQRGAPPAPLNGLPPPPPTAAEIARTVGGAAERSLVLVKNVGTRQHPLFRGEIFDPRTSLWSATGIQSGESGPTLSLPDGRILVVARPPPGSTTPRAWRRRPGESGLGSPQATIILGGVAVILLLLVLAQYARAVTLERRRIRVV
jgi:hypothetical protein